MRRYGCSAVIKQRSPFFALRAGEISFSLSVLVCKTSFSGLILVEELLSSFLFEIALKEGRRPSACVTQVECHSAKLGNNIDNDRSFGAHPARNRVT